MRRDNRAMLRQFEPLAKFSANVQVKVSQLLGFRGAYEERHVVLAPREPPLDTQQRARIIHSQLLIFASHVATQPLCKLWTDGASMSCEGDKFTLRLHHTHTKPINVRVEVDENNLFCVCFRASAMPGHENQVHRLASIVNHTLRAAHGGGGTTPAAVDVPAAVVAPTGWPAGGGAPRPAVAQSAPLAGVAAPPTAPERVLSTPLAMSAAAAAATQHYGGHQHHPSNEYPMPSAAPSAPPLDGGAQPAASSHPTDEEMAAQLQQSELMQARMTDSDLEAQMRRMRLGGNTSAATPPVPPPPAGNPKPSATVRSPALPSPYFLLTCSFCMALCTW
jgi:hypothetical protein